MSSAWMTFSFLVPSEGDFDNPDYECLSYENFYYTQESNMTIRLDFSKLTLMDALDLAVLIEVEAYERYKMFVSQLGHRFPGDATSVFSKMAENEAKHGKELTKRRKDLFGDEPMRVSLDDLFDVEAPDYGSVRFNMSPYKAFKVALSSEQKAFEFYDQALMKISDPKIQSLFIELRDEEKEHVRLVEEIIENLPSSARFEQAIDEDELPAM